MNKKEITDLYKKLNIITVSQREKFKKLAPQENNINIQIKIQENTKNGKLE
jgi:hypothetical protein